MPIAKCRITVPQLIRHLAIGNRHFPTARPSRTKPDRRCGQGAVVRDQYDGLLLFLVQAFKDGHDLAAGVGVEVAGRLIGKENPGLIHQGAGDGDALAFAAAEMLRAMPKAMLKAHLGKQFPGPAGEFRLFGGKLAQAVPDHWESIVFSRTFSSGSR